MCPFGPDTRPGRAWPLAADGRHPARVKSLELAAYSNGRPNRLGKIMNGANYWWSRAALFLNFNQIAIEAPGRHSGKNRRAVVLVAEYEGSTYLVSMLGDRSDWLRNIRANGYRADWRRRTARIPLRFFEVPEAERAPVVRAWAKRAIGGRQHLGVAPDAPLSEYEAIASRVPVLRFEAER